MSTFKGIKLPIVIKKIEENDESILFKYTNFGNTAIGYKIINLNINNFINNKNREQISDYVDIELKKNNHPNSLIIKKNEKISSNIYVEKLSNGDLKRYIYTVEEYNFGFIKFDKRSKKIILEKTIEKVIEANIIHNVVKKTLKKSIGKSENMETIAIYRIEYRNSIETKNLKKSDVPTRSEGIHNILQFALTNKRKYMIEGIKPSEVIFKSFKNNDNIDIYSIEELRMLLLFYQRLTRDSFITNEIIEDFYLILESIRNKLRY